MAMLKSEIPIKHFGHSLSLAMAYLTPMVLATLKHPGWGMYLSGYTHIRRCAVSCKSPAVPGLALCI